MKELLFDGAGRVWRVLFAFDLWRRAILLVAGDKASIGQQQLYVRLKG